MIVRCASVSGCLSEVRLILLGHTEVADLDHAILAAEDVVRFDVSMHDALIMHILHAVADLSEPGENLILAEELRVTSEVNRISQTLVDLVFQGAEVGILHVDIHLILFLDLVRVIELDDVWMVRQLLHNADFADELGVLIVNLFLTSRLYINSF